MSNVTPKYPDSNVQIIMFVNTAGQEITSGAQVLPPDLPAVLANTKPIMLVTQSGTTLP